MRLRSARALALLLPTALALGACVSVRPWRDCPQPCPDAQVATSEQVRLVSYDQRILLLDHPHPGMDEHGKFVAGLVPGGPQSEVRVYAGEICVIETRRLEANRVGANVVLVPLSIATLVVADEAGLGDLWLDSWPLDPEHAPRPCAERAPVTTP